MFVAVVAPNAQADAIFFSVPGVPGEEEAGSSDLIPLLSYALSSSSHLTIDAADGPWTSKLFEAEATGEHFTTMFLDIVDSDSTIVEKFTFKDDVIESFDAFPTDFTATIKYAGIEETRTVVPEPSLRTLALASLLVVAFLAGLRPVTTPRS
jgi:hypothetical protein